MVALIRMAAIIITMINANDAYIIGVYQASEEYLDYLNSSFQLWCYKKCEGGLKKATF